MTVVAVTNRSGDGAKGGLLFLFLLLCNFCVTPLLSGFPSVASQQRSPAAAEGFSASLFQVKRPRASNISREPASSMCRELLKEMISFLILVFFHIINNFIMNNYCIQIFYLMRK